MPPEFLQPRGSGARGRRAVVVFPVFELFFVANRLRNRPNRSSAREIDVSTLVNFCPLR